ncbi:hypothetical protein BH11MYX3_BH11MYX3_23690 [soil metagenome]
MRIFSSDGDHLLAPIALERARVISPFVLFSLVCALAVSEPTGVPLAGAVIVWNVCAISFLGWLTWALRTRRIAPRWGHAALGAMWVLPTCGTLLSQYFVRGDLLTLVLVVEIASAAIILRTTWVLGLYLLIDLVWFPMMMRDGNAALRISMLMVGTAQIVGALFQRLFHSSLVRAERQLAPLRASEQERAVLTEQLMHAQRLEVAGTLSAGVAHDMNNILGTIQNLAELQLAEPQSASARTDLTHIVAQSQRGAELTRALLAFSRRGQYRMQVLDLDVAIRELLPLLSRTLPKSLELVTRFAAGGVWVEADPSQLGQVVMNLTLNALDAMNGVGTLTITTDAVELDPPRAAALGLVAGSHVRILVTDTGCGMSEATKLRAFEPFFTTKELGKGTGLGLSTVWGVAKSHGGVVTIESTPGAGTTFAIYLPRTTASPPPPPAPPVEPQRARSTVLIVDDERLLRAGTRRILERRGHTVLEACNGEEALAVYAANAGTIGLVILDMGMPVMGGAECFDRLRQLADIPVLIATGYADDTAAQSLLARGAALIEKPYAAAALAHDVARLLALN